MISKRLQYIVDMVTYFDTIADIGCDHGYVCIELIKNNKIKKMIEIGRASCRERV